MTIIEVPLSDAGRVIDEICQAMGWSQRELSRRSGVPQTAISRLGRGHLDAMDVAQLLRLAEAGGGRIRLLVDAPFLSDRARQLDGVHARCVAYVATRLRHAGWKVATEVEILGRRGPGWIDILAFHPGTGELLVIEIKTEIDDVGRIQRTLGWYVWESRYAARRLGWIPHHVTGALIVVATKAVDERLRSNRELLGHAFPGRARSLRALIVGEAKAGIAGHGLAAIDPMSRAATWLRNTVLEDPRAAAHYSDYAAVARAVARRAEASRHPRESHGLGCGG